MTTPAEPPRVPDDYFTAEKKAALLDWLQEHKNDANPPAYFANPAFVVPPLQPAFPRRRIDPLNVVVWSLVLAGAVCMAVGCYVAARAVYP